MTFLGVPSNSGGDSDQLEANHAQAEANKAANERILMSEPTQAQQLHPQQQQQYQQQPQFQQPQQQYPNDPFFSKPLPNGRNWQ